MQRERTISCFRYCTRDPICIFSDYGIESENRSYVLDLHRLLAFVCGLEYLQMKLQFGRGTNMYNKKYIVEKIDELRRHNPLHEDLEGKICYLAYLNKGERGWILYDTGERFDPPHRLHTSEIRDVVYNEGQVIVSTINTRYVFREFK